MNPKSKSISFALVEGNDKQLTQSEAERFEILKKTILANMDVANAAFVEVGRALREIHNRRLYRQLHNSFEEFSAAFLGTRASYAYKLLRAANMTDELLAEGVSEEELPATEGGARELHRVPREKRAEVSRRAAGFSRKVGKARPDQGTIRQAAVEIVANERIAPPDVEKAVAMTITRGDDRVGTSGTQKIPLRFENVLWSLNLEVDWATFSQEEAEQAHDWLREIRGRARDLLDQINETLELLGDAVQGDQLETKSDVPKAMADNKIPEAEKQKMLEAFENGSEDVAPAKKCRGRSQGKKAGKELKSLKDLSNVLTGTLRTAGQSATTDGEWITSKNGVRVKGGQ